MDVVRLRLFGTFEVTRDGEPLSGFRSDKVRALLAYLAVENGRPHRREKLWALLWGEQPDTSAQASLRSALYNLRRLMTPRGAGEGEFPILTVTHQTVTFHVGHGQCWVDVAEFDALVAAHRSHLHQDLVHCAACVPRLARLVELYRGDFLAGLTLPDSPAFDEWRVLQQEARHRQVETALGALIAHHSALGDYDRAAHYARLQIEVVPWQEAAHRWLIWSLAMSGQRNAALVQYETCCRVLRQELDVEPDEQTTALYRQIHDGELGWDAEAGAEFVNPYKGLLPFKEADAQDFYGREALVARLLDRLGEEPTEENAAARFLVVVGPSGSGKSSVVRAGLIPALRRASQWDTPRWHIATMYPGANPVTELKRVLDEALPLPPANGTSTATEGEDLFRDFAERLPEGGRLLMFVDQAEELFTLTRDEVVRRRFMAALQTASQMPGGRVHVVMTLRADHYAHPLQAPDWARLFAERIEFTLPLAPDELRRAIEEPANRVGVYLQPELVSTLVADVGREPGALPLLQYVLTELFERREGMLMTLAAYRELGGLTGALLGRLDELYAGLSDLEKVASRQVFLRLVRLGEEVMTARRRVPIDELYGLTEQLWGDGTISVSSKCLALESVLDLFGGQRLLTFDQDPFSGTPTVEIAHEALIESWDRLRDWIRSGREDLRQGMRFRALAEAWQQAERHGSFLLRGRQLEQFEAWAAVTALVPTPLEAEYLQTSVAGREARRAEEAARRERELALEERARQRLRTLRVLQVSAVIVALILSAFAGFRQQSALRQAALARSLSLLNSAQQAMLDHNTDLALGLALEANGSGDPPLQARFTLADAAYAPGTRRILAGHDSPVEGLAISPTALVSEGSEGPFALSASADGTLVLWDLEDGQSIRRLSGHTGTVYAVSFLPGSEQALSASGDGILILWDVATGTPLRQFAGHTGAVRDVAVCPGTHSSAGAGGRTALSGGADQTLILWDLDAGQEIRRFLGHEGAVLSVAISPDGATALSGSADRSVILWDLATGEILHRMSGADDAVLGDQSATGHFGSVWDVAFLPGPYGTTAGRTALSVSQDEHAILWDLENGQIIQRFDAETGLLSVAISPDGQSALLGTLDNRLILLDLNTGEFALQLRGHAGRVRAVGFVPAFQTGVPDRFALSGAADGTLRLWDLYNGAEMRRVEFGDPGDPASAAVAISPDGRLVLTALWNGEISLWDYASGEEIRRLRGHTEMAFGGVHLLPGTPDGALGPRAVSGSGDIYAASEDHTLRLWDLETGQELGRFSGHTDKVWDTDVSADGRFVASASDDGTVRLWDVESGEAKILLDVSPQAPRSVAFSPDGRSLVAGLSGGQASNPDYSLRLLDAETGREILRLAGHSEVVTDVAFSPDGQWILSGSSDATVMLWDAASGSEILSLAGHGSGVTAVAFHPRIRLAASGEADGSILLWDLTQGVALRRYTGTEKPVTDLVFMPDGSSFLAAADTDAVHEWRVDATQEDLLAWIADNREFPELTCQQRRQYQVEPLCEASEE